MGKWDNLERDATLAYHTLLAQQKEYSSTGEVVMGKASVSLGNPESRYAEAVATRVSEMLEGSLTPRVGDENGR
jgi:hypothetical protein